MDKQYGRLPHRAVVTAVSQSRRAQLRINQRCHHARWSQPKVFQPRSNLNSSHRTPLPPDSSSPNSIQPSSTLLQGQITLHDAQVTDQIGLGNGEKTSIGFLLNPADAANRREAPPTLKPHVGSLVPPCGDASRPVGAKAPQPHDQQTLVPMAHRHATYTVQLGRRNTITNSGSPNFTFDASDSRTDTMRLKFRTEVRGLVRRTVLDQLLLQSVGKPWKIHCDESTQGVHGSVHVPIRIIFPHPPGSKLEEILRDALGSRLFAGTSPASR
ncbi:hypothetical protein CGCFRS4_v016017 [Colletotrichum fructicola]|nr:hypothetical protein CGCFRS4_v016017 [Colletotrichum fructicola]